MLRAIALLQEHRPQLYQQAIPSNPNSGGADDHEVKGAPSVRLCVSNRPKFKGSVIMFTASNFYCHEAQGSARLDVLRRGDISGVTTVTWQTKDASALAGVHYEAALGQLRFEPGERHKPINVKLIDDETFCGSCVDFAVELLDCTGGLLDQYMWQTHVTFIDDDCFPSNDYEDLLKERRYDDLPTTAMLKDYFLLNFRHPEVKKRTIKVILHGQLHNLHFVLMLFLPVYMIDYVLDPSFPADQLFFGSRQASLQFIVFLSVSSLLLLHLADQWKLARFNVGGCSRLPLQVSILRLFLNYEHATRYKVHRGTLILAMTRDVVALVTHGYKALLEIIEEFGKLFWILVYQCALPVIVNKPFDASLLWPTVLFPVAMLAFLRFRQRKTSEVLDARNNMEDGLIEEVDNAARDFQLIYDYHRRGAVLEQFQVAVRKWNVSRRMASVTTNNNRFFSILLSNIVVAVYTACAGIFVVNGSLSVGIFLTNIRVFRSIGTEWAQIYGCLLRMQSIFPAFQRIVVLMSLPTDAQHRLALSRHGQRIEMSLRGHLHSEESAGSGTDMLPIMIENIVFGYNIVDGHVPRCARVVISQGQLVAVIGPMGEGKSTLLKYLSGVILPRLDANGEVDGTFFIPSHLRVLQVTSEPLFFQGTLYANLCMGVEEPSDGNIHRVKAICRRLGISMEIILGITTQPAADMEEWPHKISHSQAHLLQLARALVTNPDVLCIHKVSSTLNEPIAKKVLRVLQEFVHHRGVEKPDQEKSMRGLRTCIVSTTKLMDLGYVDRVFRISKASSVSEIPQNEVTEDMLI